MFSSIVADIRYKFQTGNTITRLIIVNVAFFLALLIVRIILRLSTAFDQDESIFKAITHYIFLSQDVLWDAKHPWVIFSHMFTHIGFFHILFNMLVLYWFGRIAGDLLGDYRMLPLYIYSGLTGALIYLITAPVFYAGSSLHGASGAIMGIVAAAGMTAPDYQMRLLLLGDVKLKYVVFGLLVLYLVSLAGLENAGGQMAHFGGAAFGFFYVHMLRQGHDLTKGFRQFVSFLQRKPRRISRPAKRKVPMEIRYKSGTRQREVKTTSNYLDAQERLDQILDKIKSSGYQSLNEDEKKFLDDASQT